MSEVLRRTVKVLRDEHNLTMAEFAQMGIEGTLEGGQLRDLWLLVGPLVRRSADVVHNHMTRDIKAPGKCPKCDQMNGHPDTYHATDMPNPTGSFKHHGAK